VDFDKIADAYKNICESINLVIAEGVGGVRVPLTIEFDLLDLAIEFDLPIVIIASLNREMMNHLLMTIDCIRAAKLKNAGIVINNYDATTATTTKDAAEQTTNQCSGVNIISTVPYDKAVDIAGMNLGEFILGSLTNCDWAKLAKR